MISKVYTTYIECLPCRQTMERTVSRSVHPKTVKHDSQVLFKHLYGCPHDPVVKLETKAVV